MLTATCPICHDTRAPLRADGTIGLHDAYRPDRFPGYEANCTGRGMTPETIHAALGCPSSDHIGDANEMIRNVR